MNKLDRDYQELLSDILDNGVQKEDRTETGTLSVFGKQITHNMSDGFPLLTTKKIAVKTMMTELKWFLKGDTNIKYLVDNGCNIWNGDAYKKYKSLTSEKYGNDPDTFKEFVDRIKTDDEFARVWGELGPIYGKQWREWSPVAGEINKGGKDQIKELIKNLKENPDSRRLMVSAWNVSELSSMTLPPCHYGFQVYTRELSPMEVLEQAKKDGIWDDGSSFDAKDEFSKNSDGELFHEYLSRIQCDYKTRAISLMWNQRSVDTFLGLPFNIASYGLLLELLAIQVNMVPDELIGNLGDTHLYSNHKVQAAKQLEREGYDLPRIKLSNVDILEGQFDYELINYNYHPTIKAALSN